MRLRRAFSLIELLVVISIITLLMGILLPALSKARDTAIILKCAAQQKQIGIAFSVYYNDHDDRVPYAEHATPEGNNFSYDDLLAEYTNHHLTDQEKGFNGILADQSNPIFICPADPKAASASNLAVRSYSMVEVYRGRREIDANPTLPPEGMGASANQRTQTSNIPDRFLMGSSDIPAPSSTLLMSEKIYHSEDGQSSAYMNPENVQGQIKLETRCQLLRLPSDQVSNDNYSQGQFSGSSGNYQIIPHGDSNSPLFNYLYVDSHVETLHPESTVSDGTNIYLHPRDGQPYSGSWTRDSDD